MVSYKDVVRDSFKKHAGKPSKEIMRLAAAEWAKTKSRGGAMATDMSDVVNVSGGKARKPAARRVRVNVEPIQLNTDLGQRMPNYDTTNYKMFKGQMPRIVKPTTIDDSAVMQQMFGGAVGYGVSGGSGVSGGGFWDDVGDFFSSPDTWIGLGSLLL